LIWVIDLSAPVDVYSDWVDACDEVAKQAAEGASGGAVQSYHTSAGAGSGATKQVEGREGRTGEEEELGIVDDEDEMGEGGYGTDD
jgi:transcription elongation factor Elf1